MRNAEALSSNAGSTDNLAEKARCIKQRMHKATKGTHPMDDEMAKGRRVAEVGAVCPERSHEVLRHGPRRPECLSSPESTKPQCHGNPRAAAPGPAALGRRAGAGHWVQTTCWLWASLLLMALAQISLAPRVASAQLGTGVIGGRAVDVSTQQPLADVVVTATSAALQGEQIVVTDSSGTFRIPNLPPGQYSISFDLEGYHPYSR